MSVGTIRKSDGGFLYRLSIVTVALSVTVSAAICDRMSPTLKSTGVGHFGQKFPVAPLGVDP